VLPHATERRRGDECEGLRVREGKTEQKGRREKGEGRKANTKKERRVERKKKKLRR
jgi:hypothetical protein